jgi:probable phosphoglycerate mutase
LTYCAGDDALGRMNMDATRIVVIRHGETAWNAETRIQGHLDIPLNATGEWQAERLADALVDEPLAAAYTSDLLRAHRTAHAVAARHQLQVKADTGLRERAFGSFEGMTWAEIHETLPEDAQRWRKRDPAFAPGGTGESLIAFRERVLQTLDRLAAPHSGEQILLAAHGGVLDVLYRAATRQELDAPRTWKLGNAAINRLLWTREGLTLVGWADEAHLERAGEDDSGV